MWEHDLCFRVISIISLLFIYREGVVIGGGQILRDSLNAPGCDAIHITEIDSDIDCDTFIPAIDVSQFQPWYSSFPVLERGVRHCFTTYVRVKNSAVEVTDKVNRSFSDERNLDSTKFDARMFSFLPKKIFENHEEYLYLNLVEDIISNGALKGDRTGTGTMSKFGCQMRFNLRKSFPLLTTKKVFWRGVVEELLLFISGSTSAKIFMFLIIRFYKIRDSYLGRIVLVDREEGDLGPVYGFQWRHFGARYTNMHADYTGQGFDQLLDVIDKIKNNPDDRRILLSALSALSALPPYHMFAQFYVNQGELSCQMYRRSADMGLAVPFNIASYALLTCMIAHVCGMCIIISVN
ncbi:bifunctional dihydrofolate reductase-thymidylate synthase [Artemisia annua]|uniref:thymidylate synthase n=1 Tax=Artemisia annua TaxID=35608 RepID=A0A2U1P3C1_ARTAN|nr:bifunctional dihydrofolate reductase-thymidylate synthase [Artemisia annua]